MPKPDFQTPNVDLNTRRERIERASSDYELVEQLTEVLFEASRHGNRDVLAENLLQIAKQGDTRAMAPETAREARQYLFQVISFRTTEPEKK